MYSGRLAGFSLGISVSSLNCLMNRLLAFAGYFAQIIIFITTLLLFIPCYLHSAAKRDYLPILCHILRDTNAEAFNAAPSTVCSKLAKEIEASQLTLIKKLLQSSLLNVDNF